MKYKNMIWIFVIGGVLVLWNMLTSPDAYTAGQRSSGLVALMIGAAAGWFILEMFSDKKKPEG